MHLVPLEVAQEIVNHLGLRHEIGGADQTLPAEVGRFAQMGQKVFDVQHALDIVLRALIDGDAAIIILDDTLQHLGKGSPYVQVNNVHSAGHHLACHLAAEAYDTLQHAAFLGNVLLVGEFHSLLQIVHREALRLRMDKSLGDDLAAYQDVAERRAELHEHGECRSSKAAEGERGENQSELVPYWCFGKNQKVKIERIVPMYPMSKDEIKYERLIRILSLYRITMGQARQEELLEYLFNEYENKEELKKLFIDLSPFSKERKMNRE